MGNLEQLTVKMMKFLSVMDAVQMHAWIQGRTDVKVEIVM